MYTAEGKLAIYWDLTLPAFVKGYVMVLGMEKDTRIRAHTSQHLEDLMEDADLYRTGEKLLQ